MIHQVVVMVQLCCAITIILMNHQPQHPINLLLLPFQSTFLSTTTAAVAGVVVESNTVPVGLCQPSIRHRRSMLTV